MAAQVAIEEEEPRRSGPSSRCCCAVVAAGLARKAVDGAWKVATGKKPPDNPADPDVDAREAVAWALMTGVAIGVGADARAAQGGRLLREDSTRPSGRPASDTRPRKCQASCGG